jgi:hypothetical protein
MLKITPKKESNFHQYMDCMYHPNIKKEILGEGLTNQSLILGNDNTYIKDDLIHIEILFMGCFTFILIPTALAALTNDAKPRIFKMEKT